MVDGGSTAAKLVQSIGPVPVPLVPVGVQMVFCTGVKSQVPAKLTDFAGRGPE